MTGRAPRPSPGGGATGAMKPIAAPAERGAFPPQRRSAGRGEGAGPRVRRPGAEVAGSRSPRAPGRPFRVHFGRGRAKCAPLRGPRYAIWVPVSRVAVARPARKRVAEISERGRESPRPLSEQGEFARGRPLCETV
eukprot:scaffold1243_cov403-Prasinococcus_capsulatus_cf.AAC.24